MTAQPGFVPHVMTLGTGARRALALHCTMAFGGTWRAMSKATPDLTLVAPDMPSHGRSADWDTASDFPETVYHASLGAMDAEPMDVIGHSFGAVIALRLAVSHPARVRSLTIIEPVFFCIARADAPETVNQHDSDARPYLDAVERGDREAAAQTFNGMWGDGPAWESIPARNRAAMVRGIHVVPGCTAFLYDDTANIMPRLSALPMPTLVMRGAAAHPAIAATNAGLAARIPGAKAVVIAQAGHMAPITHAAEVAAEITAFLASVNG